MSPTAVEPVPLLLAALGLLVYGAVVARLAARRITRPLRRLATTLARMAPTGQLDSEFESAGGSREVLLIEDSFRTLALS
ncbi:MAG TPA: HAMP domain-containing protein, partial [Thermoanaerobaculia bacterium]